MDSNTQSSSDEIVIKTEVVNISQLVGREKQIYDYAYKRGLERGTTVSRRIVSFAIFGYMFFVLTVAFFIAKLF